MSFEFIFVFEFSFGALGHDVVLGPEYLCLLPLILLGFCCSSSYSLISVHTYSLRKIINSVVYRNVRPTCMQLI